MLVVSLGAGITSFTQLQSTMSQMGVYTVITLGADQVFLYNVSVSQLTADNFMFM